VEGGDSDASSDEERDSDLDSVGSFNSQDSAHRSLGPAGQRQAKLEHDKMRADRIQMKRAARRQAKIDESISITRARIIAEMKQASTDKDVHALRQAISRA